MLTNKKFARLFWVEAVNAACYAFKHCFIRPSPCQYLYELLNDKKPNIKHLRVFGSTFYILKNGENPDKFEVKRDLGIFLSFSSNNRAYRVFNMRNSIVMESINMVINDSGATKMFASYDSDVFENQGSIEDVTSDIEWLTYIVSSKPPKSIKDEEKDSYLSK